MCTCTTCILAKYDIIFGDRLTKRPLSFSLLPVEQRKFEKWSTNSVVTIAFVAVKKCEAYILYVQYGIDYLKFSVVYLYNQLSVNCDADSTNCKFIQLTHQPCAISVLTVTVKYRKEDREFFVVFIEIVVEMCEATG